MQLKNYGKLLPYKEVKRDYSVYYRTGGTLNFKWQKTFITYTKKEAIEAVSELKTQGYKAHYAKTKQLDSIGLPGTY